MTVAVAVKGESGIYLATDSLVSGAELGTGNKIWSPSEDVAVAVAGDMAIMTYLMGEAPQEIPEEANLAWLWTNIFRPLTRDRVLAKLNWEALMVFRGSLMCADSGGVLYEELEPVLAIGSGAAYALGSLDETAHLPTNVRVKRAVESACKHAADCSPPVVVKKIPY